MEVDMADKGNIKRDNLNVEIPDNEAIINYSNFAIVSHSPEEFVIDFARILPGKEGAKVISRVIMTPKNAKNFMMAMNNNIANFEKQFGEIILPQNPHERFGEVQ
jgi:hypothetical protein